MERTMTMKELIEQCEPAGGDNVYFRPFSGGDPAKAEIFLAGINPATIIKKERVEFNEYSRMLKQPGLKDLNALYEKTRIENGQTKESRTRMGIKSFSGWLRKESGKEVLETDVVAYPTSNASALKTTENALVEKGTEIFIDLLKMQRPKILVIHGKGALSYLLYSIKDKIDVDQKLDQKDISPDIRSLEENKKPLFTINFSKGEKCKVFVCRHLQYYGRTGESYEDFRKTLKIYLKKL
jgi:hypothetical protein